MSRSKRKPYIKDSTRCNKYWKRQATRALRHAKEAIVACFTRSSFVAGFGVTTAGLTLRKRKHIGNKNVVQYFLYK